jgi:rod shape-determining protein MreD
MILILQSFFSTYIRIGDVVPNLFLIFVISYAVIGGSKYGFWWGVVVGLIWDSLSGIRFFGISAISFMYIGLLVGSLSHRFYRENTFPTVSFVFIMTFLYNIMLYVLLFFSPSGFFTWEFFSKTIGVEMIYNSFVAIFVHKFVSKMNSYLDERSSYY